MDHSDRTELTKIRRVFKLIELMSGGMPLTTKQYAQRLGVSRKPIERYYKLLEDIGYHVDKDPKTHRYFIAVDPGLADSFEAEEANYLNDVLRNLPDDTPMRRAILLKLNKQYRLSPMVQVMQRHGNYDKLRRLRQSMVEGKTVVLSNYLGGEGKLSPSRHIAVTGFTERDRAIHAIDLDVPEGEDPTRMFIIERIGQVELTTIDVPEDLDVFPNDIFGWPGKRWYNIRLRLGPLAHQLLLEECPNSRPYLTDGSDGRVIADLNVRGWQAVGRFCLGLPGEVEVLKGGDGMAFKAYLNHKNIKTW